MRKSAVYSSCPANTFLIGEFAILYGYPAAVLSINKRLRVRLSPADKLRIFPKASNSLPVSKTIEFLAEKYDFKPYFQLEVYSEIPPGVGLGSSDACIVATTGAVLGYFGVKLSKLKILDLCHEIRSSMERCSKGALSAAVFGGTTILEKGKLKKVVRAKPRLYTFAFTGIHKTNPVLPFLERYKKNQIIYSNAIKSMGEVSKEFVKNINEPQPQLLNNYQELMRVIGASNSYTDTFISDLLGKGAFGAKLSGGGRGDGAVCLAPKGFYKKLDTFAFEIVNDNKGLVVSEV